MGNKEILSRLKSAVNSNTPDVLDSILLRCEQLDYAQQEGETDMTRTSIAMKKNIINMPGNTSYHIKSRTPWLKWAAGAAAMLMLVLGGNFAHQYYSVDSIISLDVNPSIELKVNQAENVLSAIPRGEDAVIVLDDMSLKNVDLNVAVNALIGSMLKYGYVDEAKNSILISVENANTQRGAELQKRLSDEVSSLLDAYSIDGAVLSQTMSDDERLKSLADEHEISLGKAALVDLIVSADSRYAFADIAALPINDINLLISNRQVELGGVSSSGQASSSAYIGESKAKSIALADADILETTATFSKTKLDFDDRRMVYEVEVYTSDAEYEYEIDALTGQIVSRDIDRKRQPQTGSSGSGDAAEAYIGEAKAKSIALSHAGLSESEVRRMEVELERSDGRMVYDVEFKHDNIEYEYEIDAVSGDILEYDRDYDD
ncbi:MAG: PepSY domain-containing protein [Clostridiales bacterium]|nr:PepSY domain-containing protein [Clostridiales bacterium]